MCVCVLVVVLQDRIGPSGSWHVACFTLSADSSLDRGYFSIFKHGMKRIHQHCEGKYVHRYLAEFDFRYNTRAATTTFMRAEEAAISIKGKRLTCRRPCKKPYPPQAGSEAFLRWGKRHGST
jgi:hypothetical protein